MMDDGLDEYRDNFWNLIQNALGIPVSVHLKNIFKFSDLDNKVALMGLKENGFDFNELQTFVRSENYKMNVDDDNLMNFYGRTFAKNPEKFCFTMGEESIMKQILALVWDDTKNAKIRPEQWKKLQKKSFSRAKSSNRGSAASSAGLDSCPENYSNRPNFDRSAEIEKIKALINEPKKLKSLYPNELLTHLTGISITVSQDESGDISSLITCSVCDKTIKCNKIVDNKLKRQSTAHWNLSNFIRHFLNHSNLQYGKKQTPNKKLVKTSAKMTRNVTRKVSIPKKGSVEQPVIAPEATANIEDSTNQQVDQNVGDTSVSESENQERDQENELQDELPEASTPSFEPSSASKTELATESTTTSTAIPFNKF